jgi:hypothetical protein
MMKQRIFDVGLAAAIALAGCLLLRELIASALRPASRRRAGWVDLHPAAPDEYCDRCQHGR